MAKARLKVISTSSPLIFLNFFLGVLIYLVFMMHRSFELVICVTQRLRIFYNFDFSYSAFHTKLRFYIHTKYLFEAPFLEHNPCENDKLNVTKLFNAMLS